MLNHLRQWFASPEALWLLALLPVLGLLALRARRRRRRALLQMGSGLAFEGLGARRGPWRRLRGLLLTSALVWLVFGVAGPRWGRDWEQTPAPGRDLVVVLDVSRSMLAETPSRLERSKKALLDLCAAMQKQGGHRLGLVLFAGHAWCVVPLTHDFDHFRDVIRGLDGKRLDPELRPPDAAKSGTRMGEGLRLAVKSHDERYAGARDILLLSDGDDPAGEEAGQEEWRDGALAARAAGIPVHVIGVGDPAADHFIPTADGPQRFGTEQVVTRLREKPLRETARLTEGTYTPAHTRTLALGEMFVDRLAAGTQREDDAGAVLVYRPRYVWFLMPAFVLLFGATLIGDGRRENSP